MDDKPRPSLEDLDSRLRKARGGNESGNRGRLPGTRLGQALHLAIEMAAALAVGGGIGWLLDEWLGTRPWLFVVFIFRGDRGRHPERVSGGTENGGHAVVPRERGRAG